MFRDAQAHAFATYLLTLTIILSPLWVRRAVTLLTRSRSFSLTTSLLIFLCLSTLWSPGSAISELVSQAGKSLFLICFIIAIAYMSVTNSTRLSRLIALFVLLAAFSGFAALYEEISRFGVEHALLNWRLVSDFGRLENPVIVGATFGGCAILSFISFWQAPTLGQKLLSFIILTVLLVFVILSGSRGALIALSVSAITSYAQLQGYFKGFETLKYLLIIQLLGISLTVWFTSTQIHPFYLSDNQRSLSDINPNSDLSLLDSTGKFPLDIMVGYGSADNSKLELATRGKLKLKANENLTGIGAVWPAFKIEDNVKYFVRAIVSISEVTTTKGLSITMEESDSSQIISKHISRYAENSQQPMDLANRDVDLVSLKTDSLDPQEYIIQYTPTSTAVWASPIVINQSGSYFNQSEHGPVNIVIDQLSVYRIPVTGIETINSKNSNRSSKWRKWLSRGPEARSIIWTDGLASLKPLNWLFGLGAGIDTAITPRDGKSYEHMHNMVLSTLRYGGLVSATIFIALLLSANRTIYVQNNRSPQRKWLLYAQGLLVFALVLFAFDGNRILTKIDYVWFILWVPIALICGQELKDTSSNKNEW